jgi:hypothetical protein
LKKLFQGGKPPALTAAQLQAFVEQQGRSASSLLAAWKLDGGSAWLDEAAQRFPENPHVALAKLSGTRRDHPDAKVWIERLKRNDPENATGWCYDALGHLQKGDSQQARAALAEAAQGRRLDGYLKESRDTIANAYRSAGYGAFESEIFGRVHESIPLAGLAREMQGKTLSAGLELDRELTQDMLAVSNLVRGSSESPLFVTQIVASGMEEDLLKRFEAHERVPGTDKLVFERLGELAQEQATLADLRQKAAPLFLSNRLQESELKQYLRRSTLEGDVQAVKWLLSQHPELK